LHCAALSSQTYHSAPEGVRPLRLTVMRGGFVVGETADNSLNMVAPVTPSQLATSGLRFHTQKRSKVRNTFGAVCTAISHGRGHLMFRTQRQNSEIERTAAERTWAIHASPFCLSYSARSEG
jgi:hypothetical protein